MFLFFRYLCSVASGAPVAYVALTSLMGFIIPVIAIIVLYIFIIRRAVGERSKDRPRVASEAYTDAVLQPSSRFWTELNTSKYVGVLVILWCIFQGPYLLLSYVEQFRNSDKFNDQQVELTYPWRVELSFTWMKLSYPIFLPLITFCWRKEVWQKFKNLILCRKSNLINDSDRHASPHRRRRPQAPSRQVSEGIGRRTPGIKESISCSTDINKNDSVPVLFATENGLHFQSYGNRALRDDNDETHDEDSLGELESSKTSKVATARKCDVFGSQFSFKNADDDMVDTSDYNSSAEVDSFSNSNARAEFDQQRNRKASLSNSNQGRRSRQNSESNEDVDGTQKRRRKKKEISPREMSDSGINSNQNTKEKNRKNRRSKGQIDDVIEDVFEKELQTTKDDSQREHNRTSSDSGQGSHEGSMSKRDGNRVRPEDLANEEPHLDDQVFEIRPGDENRSQFQGKNDTKHGDHDLHNHVSNENDIIETDTTNSKPRKKRKRRRKKEEDDNNAQIVNRPLPELRSVKSAVNEGNLYYSAGDINSATAEDEEMISELQMHQPPPPRLKPITHKREQVSNKLQIFFRKCDSVNV